MAKKKFGFFLWLFAIPLCSFGQNQGTGQEKSGSGNDSPLSLGIKKEQIQDYRMIAPGGSFFLPPPDPSAPFEKEMEKYRHFPLSPEELLQWRKEILRQEEAKTRPIINPEIRNRVIQVSLDASQKIQEIYVAPGYVTTLAIVDSAGKAWPLADDVVVGDKEAYFVRTSDKAPNIVSIAAAKTAGSSTISLLLQEQSVPVIFKLVTSLKTHDARVDLMVPGLGPNSSKDPLTNNVAAVPTTSADETLMAFVSGVPPSEAKELKAQTTLFRVWYYKGSLYLRTSADLMSPAWEGEARGAGGVKVYRLQKTPVVLISDQGAVQMTRIDISDI